MTGPPAGPCFNQKFSLFNFLKTYKFQSTLNGLKWIFSRSGTSRSGTVIGNSLSVCLHLCSCCSSHRQDWPHVYYTKRSAWTPRWCTSNLFFGCYQIWPPGGQKTAFLGSSSAHRQDQPHVYYTKRSAWTPRWCLCHLFFGCYQICPPGGQKTAFLALAQLTDKIDPKYIIPKWPATWIFLKLF